MTDQYAGEIRMFGGNYVPDGWHSCDGSSLQISEYNLLYAVIGTTFGGDGVSTFNLPDLRGRVPISAGTGSGLTPRVLGQGGGAETVSLTEPEMPPHTHAMTATTAPGTTTTPGTGNILAAPVNTVGGKTLDYRYIPSNTALGADLPMNAGAVTNTGQNVPHANIMQSMPINFIIALNGTFPSPDN